MGIGGRRSNREKRVNPGHVAVPHCPIFPTGGTGFSFERGQREGGQDCRGALDRSQKDHRS